MTPGAHSPGGRGPAPLPPRSPLVPAALLFYGALLALALLFAALSGRSPWFASAADVARGVSWGRDLAVGALAAGVVIGVSSELSRSGRGEAAARTLGAALGRLSLPECWILALVSGFAEELAFRGVLQPRVGLVAASLIFGLAHYPVRPELRIWTAFAVGVGLLFGLLFEFTGNLVAPCVAHTLVNGVNLRLLSRRFGAPA